jgi:hypothetical protein
VGFSSLQLSALSRLFSSGVFREMAGKGKSRSFARLIAEAGIAESADSWSVGDAFDAAFATLRRSGIRSEYVYRAALTHNVLLGTHSLKTASMLTEFRAGECKADVAILNGTATVYEIKSERDSLARLANQIANYRKIFAKIYVIAGSAHIEEVLDIAPSDVGVMCLSRWDRITTIREATDRPDQVCPIAILESIRSAEACAMLREIGLEVPAVPNTALRSALHRCFERIPAEVAHRAMVNTLKRSRNLASLGTLIEKLPKSLQPAALSVQVRRTDRDRLVDAVTTPLSAAMSWA